MFCPLINLPPLALAVTLLATSAMAQLPKPVNPPPWWGVADNDTVSIYWSFDNPQAPFAHHPQSVVPSWYTFPANDGFTQRSGPTLQWQGNVSGHTGVLGFTGNGTAQSALLNLQIDNDPRVNWIKVFYFQFESTATSSGKATALIEENLAQYKRLSTTENTVAIGNGWVRTTVTAELLPQPAYEAVEFTLTEGALASVGIDNLFINSKCVKPWNDEDGDALGEVDATQQVLDLQNVTGNAQCEAAAVSEDAQGVRTYWISGSGNAAGQAHTLYRVTSTGQPAGTPVVIGNYSTTNPLGLTALTYENTGFNQGNVHGIRDLRLVNGTIELVSYQTATGTLSARSLQTQGLSLPAAPHRFGLTFYPPGDTGAGSFWITDNQDVNGAASSGYEFSRSGVLLNPSTSTNNNLIGQLPARTLGAGYDPLKGTLYFVSAEPQTTAIGSTRTNVLEYSGYDLRPTGVQYYGNLQLTDPLGPGGAAKSLQVYRRLTGEWRSVMCVAAAGRTLLYEQKGPFRFGFNQLGRCGMRGAPIRGATSFQVTLSGVPRASGAVLYAGFNNIRYGTVPLPYSLAQFGLLESNISVSLDMNSVFLPVVNGSCSATIPLLPPGASPPNVPLFFQWVVFDPSVRNGVATSQAGKVLIY